MCIVPVSHWYCVFCAKEGFTIFSIRYFLCFHPPSPERPKAWFQHRHGLIIDLNIMGKLSIGSGWACPMGKKTCVIKIVGSSGFPPRYPVHVITGKQKQQKLTMLDLKKWENTMVFPKWSNSIFYSLPVLIIPVISFTVLLLIMQHLVEEWINVDIIPFETVPCGHA